MRLLFSLIFFKHSCVRVTSIRNDLFDPISQNVWTNLGKLSCLKIVTESQTNKPKCILRAFGYEIPL